MGYIEKYFQIGTCAYNFVELLDLIDDHSKLLSRTTILVGDGCATNREEFALLTELHKALKTVLSERAKDFTPLELERCILLQDVIYTVNYYLPPGAVDQSFPEEFTFADIRALAAKELEGRAS